MNFLTEPDGGVKDNAAMTSEQVDIASEFIDELWQIGVFELIPDFVPVVGNLDEAGATLLFLKCLSTLRTASPASPDAPK